MIILTSWGKFAPFLPVFGVGATVIANALKITTYFKRFGMGKFQRKQLAVIAEIRRYRNFRKIDSNWSLGAEAMRDLAAGLINIALCVVMLLMLTLPNFSFDAFMLGVSGVEAFLLLLLALYSFNRLLNRLRKLGNPYRTLLLQEAKLMQIRLAEAEARISKLKAPILRRDLIRLRVLNKGISAWRIW